VAADGDRSVKYHLISYPVSLDLQTANEWLLRGMKSGSRDQDAVAVVGFKKRSLLTDD
jgi:hypothetical protein